jgi:hypothetical protein
MQCHSIFLSQKYNSSQYMILQTPHSPLPSVLLVKQTSPSPIVQLTNSTWPRSMCWSKFIPWAITTLQLYPLQSNSRSDQTARSTARKRTTIKPDLVLHVVRTLSFVLNMLWKVTTISVLNQGKDTYEASTSIANVLNCYTWRVSEYT